MASSSTTERSDLLRKIRALIAKADDRAVTPEEADIFRAKADELMVKYAVEQFELMKAGAIEHAPETRNVDMSFWFDYDSDPDARSNMWVLFSTVYRHCRCVVVHDKMSSMNKTMMVAGYPGDLDWADLLFTSLLLQLERAVNPRPSRDRSYHENLCDLRAGGLSWDEVWERMARAGTIPDQILAQFPNRNGQRDKMIRDYRAYCARTGTPQNYNHWKTFRRSFSAGFISQMSTRLNEQRARNEQTGGSQFAVVLRDVYKTVQEWLYDEGIMVRPKPVTPSADTIKKGRRVSYPKDTRKYDWGAVLDGRRAADNADITGHPGRRVNGNQGQLDG